MTGGLSEDTNVFKDALSVSARNTLSFNEQEILDILAKIRYSASAASEHQVLERIKMLTSGGPTLLQDQFIAVLIKEGNLSQYDAVKVANFFTLGRGQVNVIQFEEYLKKAL